MRTIRLYVDLPLAAEREVALPPGAAAHAARVLRLQPGALVTLFNGDGHDYPSRLLAAGRGGTVAAVDARLPGGRESPLRIVLAQALARGEKMDWIVQKATELGVAAIVPLVTERCEVKLDAARAAKRVEHWQAVAIGACEQSGRSVLPSIAVPLALDAWLGGLQSNASARLMLHPGDSRPLRDLPSMAECVLAIGPEGGFGEHDLAALHESGFTDVSVGPRVLRTETAGLAAMAALQALHGDF